MTSENIDIFLSFLRECEQKYHMAEADEQEANNLTQDILHSLELKNHTLEDPLGELRRLYGIDQ